MKDSYQDKKVESFLRSTNFYKYLIKNFSYIVKPLNELKEKKERVEMERRISEDIQKVKGKDHKPTSTYSTQKRRKIQSRDR